MSLPIVGIGASAGGLESFSELLARVPAHTGMAYVFVQHLDPSHTIVPNGTIIANKVTNWTYSDRYRAVEIPVSVARGVDPQRVLELLKSVAGNHPSIAEEPVPQAYIVNFAPGAVSFQLRAWTDRYEDWVQVRSDLSLAVDRALTEKISRLHDAAEAAGIPL